MRIQDVLLKTYEGKMDVYERNTVMENGRSVEKDVLVLEGIPCALSKGFYRQKKNEIVKQERTARVEYEAVIFAPPQYTIRSGSRIVAEQLGKRYSFVSTGEASVYPDHQEIAVRREEDAGWKN